MPSGRLALYPREITAKRAAAWLAATALISILASAALMYHATKPSDWALTLPALVPALLGVAVWMRSKRRLAVSSWGIESHTVGRSVLNRFIPEISIPWGSIDRAVWWRSANQSMPLLTGLYLERRGYAKKKVVPGLWRDPNEVEKWPSPFNERISPQDAQQLLSNHPILRAIEEARPDLNAIPHEENLQGQLWYPKAQ